MKIYINEIKKIKGIPALVKKEVKFTGSIDQKILELQKLNTTYFELVENGAKTKMTFSKPIGSKNYIKKEVKA